MNKYRTIEEIVDCFQARYNNMADQADGVPTAVTNEMIDLVHMEMSKEVDEVVAQEKATIKSKNKMYKKLLSAKRQIATVEKADAWFDKVFKKYFNKGILEHLIVYAIKFLHRNELFVPKRLFMQIDNDELLGQFTYSAMEYLGWLSQTDGVEPPTNDEAEQIDEQATEEETTDSDEETEQEAETTDVTVYEPKEIQPTEPQQQPVVKVERTITHEVMTATQGTPPTEPPVTDNTVDDGIDEDSDETPVTSSKKTSYWDGRRKNGTK